MPGSTKKKSSKKFPRKSTKNARPSRLEANINRDILFDRKVIGGATCATLLAFLFQIIATCTEYWLILEIPEGIYNNKTNRSLVKLNTGLWKLCVTHRLPDGSEVETCEKHQMFPEDSEIRKNARIDRDMLDFMRTETAFAIIGMLLIALGHCFAFYTFRRPRYILKRLTALLHLMTAGSLLVLNEVFSRAVTYSKENLPHLYPSKSDNSFGASFVLSWIDFCIFLICGLIFLLSSAKRKADMADINDAMIEADEPMQLGRV